MEKGKAEQQFFPFSHLGAFFKLFWFQSAKNPDKVVFDSSWRFIGDFDAFHQKGLREDRTRNGGEPESEIMVDILLTANLLKNSLQLWHE